MVPLESEWFSTRFSGDGLRLRELCPLWKVAALVVLYRP